MEYLGLFVFGLFVYFLRHGLFEISVFGLFEIICRLFVDYLSLEYLCIIRNMDFLRLLVYGLFVLDYL